MRGQTSTLTQTAVGEREAEVEREKNPATLLSGRQASPPPPQSREASSKRHFEETQKQHFSDGREAGEEVDLQKVQRRLYT